MADFHETEVGRVFFEQTMPAIAQQLAAVARVAAQLEQMNRNLEALRVALSLRDQRPRSGPPMRSGPKREDGRPQWGRPRHAPAEGSWGGPRRFGKQGKGPGHGPRARRPPGEGHGRGGIGRPRNDDRDE